MVFISSEQRSRNAVAEHAIGVFQDSLQSTALRQKLGESIGRFAAIADRLYVPNVNHSIVSPPPEHKNTEGIAVIVLRPSDQISVSEHFTQQSQKQRAQMQAQLVQAGLPETDAGLAAKEVDALVASDQGMRPTRINSGIHLNSSIEAETWTTQYPLSIDRAAFTNVNPAVIKWARLGMPTMLVRYGASYDAVSPSLMLHESVHIDQRESEPLQPIFHPHDRSSRRARRLTTELPAYNIGATGVNARLEEGLDKKSLPPADRMQLAVEGVRQAICPEDDPFDTACQHTIAICEALVKIEID
jgi:hypothetical protein